MFIGGIPCWLTFVHHHKLPKQGSCFDLKGRTIPSVHPRAFHFIFHTCLLFPLTLHSAPFCQHALWCEKDHCLPFRGQNIICCQRLRGVPLSVYQCHLLHGLAGSLISDGFFLSFIYLSQYLGKHCYSGSQTEGMKFILQSNLLLLNILSPFFHLREFMISAP